MFSFFSENELILQNQSKFRLGDFCANQLLSIAPEILPAFGGGCYKVSWVFLDISECLNELAWRFAFQVTTKQDIRRADDSNKSSVEL